VCPVNQIKAHRFSLKHYPVWRQIYIPSVFSVTSIHMEISILHASVVSILPVSNIAV